MTKSFFIVLALTLSTNIFAVVKPVNEEATNTSLSLNAFIKHSKRWTTSIQARLQDNEVQSKEKSLQLGLRYKLASNWKIGFFLKREYGLRHNEDWKWLGPANYKWIDTEDRGETSLIPFVQYKARLPFKTDMAFKFRLNYQHNTFNEQEDIHIRSGFINILSPDFTMINQINIIIPTNYSQRFITYYGYYFSVGWQINRHLTLGPEVRFNQKFWNESVSFRLRENDTYEVKLNNFDYGIVLNSYF